MWTEHRAEHVVGGSDVRHPVPHRFIDSVLQCSASRRHGYDSGAEQFHAKNVQFLAANIFLAHVNIALETQTRADRCSRYAVLAGAGFGNDAFLAHAARKQPLAEAVVDLVSARVIQILALEINLRAAPCFRQPFGEIQRSRPAGIIVEEILKFRVERGIALRLRIGSLEFLERMH